MMGNNDKSVSRQSGVTLIEMLIVVTLLSLMVGITFPSISAGLDSIRMATSADSIVAFFNGALNRAERRQEVIEIEINPTEHKLVMRSAQPGFEKTLELSNGIEVSRILPAPPDGQNRVRRFLLFPGGAVPRFGVELENKRGARRIVRVDPLTGVPKAERVEE